MWTNISDEITGIIDKPIFWYRHTRLVLQVAHGGKTGV